MNDTSNKNPHPKERGVFIKNNTPRLAAGTLAHGDFQGELRTSAPLESPSARVPRAGKIQMGNKNVEDYIISTSVRSNIMLQKLEEATDELAEKQMRISADQAQFMQFFLKSISAKRVLEIGMFTGYSALAMAQALPDEGYLLTCDLSDRYLSLARAHWKEAGVENKITVKLGLAIHTLKELIEQKVEKFDFVFIDADKLNYEEYVHLSLQLINKQGIIALDNTLAFGKHFVPIDDGSPSTSCIRELNKKLFNNTQLDLTIIPIGGGLTLLRKV